MKKKKTSDNKKENIRETVPKRRFTSRFDLLNRFRHWYMGGASLTRSIFRVKAAWQTIIVIIVILCIFFMVAAVYTQSGEFVINIDSQMADDGFYLSETTDFSERLITLNGRVVRQIPSKAQPVSFRNTGKGSCK